MSTQGDPAAMSETVRHASAPDVATHPASESPRSSESKAHAYAREQGVSHERYAMVRALALVALRAWFRVSITGREHIPAEGSAIIAPNHKSSLDVFFIGIATRRHVRYMAKAELFKGPLAWLLPRLGAFPGSPRRGRSRGARDGPNDPSRRRRGRPVSRGHACRATGRARITAPRCRTTRVRDRDADHPGRHHRYLATVARRAPEDPARAADLPARGATRVHRGTRCCSGTDRRARLARRRGGIRPASG